MGREVKRVHKLFDWPLNKIWWGYTLPELVCQGCWGEGEVEHKTCGCCRGENHVTPVVEPPKGYDYNNSNYWQMWETVSEGSPISPPMPTKETLAKWLVGNAASSFGPMKATYEEWLAMIEQGSSVSAMITNKGLISGVEACKEDNNA